MTEKKCIYLFLRKDLDPSQQIIQASHVCLELGRFLPLPDERYRIIILGIRSEPKLLSVINELNSLNILHKTFKEPDLNFQLTAIATEPLNEERSKLFSRYRLL
jgi:hypothetical protein